MRKPLSAEETLYRLGLALLPVFFFAAVFVAFSGQELLGWMPPCWVHERTGLYCPGCGATRAVVALARLHPVESFCYHPFIPYTALIYGLFLIWETLRRRFAVLHPFPIFPCIVAGIVLLVLQCVWKNAAVLNGWNPFFVL